MADVDDALDGDDDSACRDKEAEAFSCFSIASVYP
jgi:hypothetical protein